MGKIIAATALIGWSVIAWIAWHQANARIDACPYRYSDDGACIQRATQSRDFIMSVGLFGALLIILAALIVFAILKARSGQPPVSRVAPGWVPTSSDAPARLR